MRARLLMGYFLFLLTTKYAHGQSIYLFQQKGRLGVKNYESNKVIIPAEYTQIIANKNRHSSNYWNVKKDGLWGLMDNNGSLLLPIKYEMIEDFKNGFARIKYYGKTGLIDIDGHIIIEPLYQNLSWTKTTKFPSIFWTKENDSSIILNSKGIQTALLPYAVVNSNEEGTRLIVQDKKSGTGVCDAMGNILIPLVYNSISIEGSDFFLCKNKDVSTRFVFDSTGKFLFENSGLTITPLSHKTFFVKLKQGYSYIDSLGNKITADTFQTYLLSKNSIWLTKKNKTNKTEFLGYSFSTNIFSEKTYDDVMLIGNNSIVKKNNEWGVLDQDLKVIIPFEYDNVYSGNADTLKILRSTEKTVLLWGSNNIVVLPNDKKNEIQYIDISVNNTSGDTVLGALAVNSTGYGALTIHGKTIVPLSYEKIRFVNANTIQVRLKGETYLFDFAGKIQKEKNEEKNIPAGKASPPPFIHGEKIKNLPKKEFPNYIFYDAKGKELFRCSNKVTNFLNFFKIISLEKSKNYGLLALDGEFLIPCIYDKLYSLNDELFIAKLNEKVGIIDRANNIVIPFVYSSISKLTANTYKVVQDNKWGVIDPANKIIIPLIYSSIEQLTNGKFEVSINNQYGIIDSINKIVVPLIYSSIKNFTENTFEIVRNNKHGVISPSNKLLIPVLYDYLTFPKTGENFSIAIKNKRYGVITLTDSVLIPFEYDNIRELPNKTLMLKRGTQSCMVFIGQNVSTSTCYEEIIPTNYSSNLFIRKNKKMGVIDQDGKIIIPAEYDIISERNPYYQLYNNKLYGLANMQGKIVLPVEQDSIKNIVNDIWKIQKNKKWGVIKYEKLIIPQQYEDIQYFGYDDSTFYLIKQKERYFFANKSGIVNLKKSYDQVYSFNENYFKIKDKGKLGIINTKGKTLLTSTYEDISSTADKNFYTIRKDGKLGLISSKFEEKIPCLYDTLFPLTMTKYFIVMQGKLYGLCDPEGHLLLPVIYEDITNSSRYYEKENKVALSSFSNKLDLFSPNELENMKAVASVFMVRKNQKYGLMSTTDTLQPIIYDEIEPAGTNFILMLGDKSGACDKEGKIIIPLIYYLIDADDLPDLFFVDLKEKKAGIIDKNGKIVIPIIYKDVYFREEDNLFYAEVNDDTTAIFNMQGNLIVKLIYQDFDEENFGNQILVTVKKKNGLISKKDGRHTAPVIYDDIKWEKDNKYYLIEKDNKLGVINENGKLIIPAKYDDIEWLESGKHYLVENDDKDGLIDENGKLVVPTKYDGIEYDKDDKNFILKIDKNNGDTKTRTYSKEKGLSGWETEKE
jgi:hypothetical protein